MKCKRIAVVGMGQFGTFMSSHLVQFFEVIRVTRHTNPGVLSACDIVIYSVPFASLKEVILKTKPYISPKALILDVTSVKQKPLLLLKKHFPRHQILGTHPVFGPQSGKHCIANLPIVLCNVSCFKVTYKQISAFLQDTLKLTLIELTPQEHDRQMAKIQGLTHFIGRALVALEIESFPTNTKSYTQLLELKNLLQFDSWELFATIQNVNPEAKKVRKQFLRKLYQLEEALERPRIS